MAEQLQEYRLTEWCEQEEELSSHIAQLDKTHIPYCLVQREKLGWTIYIKVYYNINEYNEKLLYPVRGIAP